MLKEKRKKNIKVFMYMKKKIFSLLVLLAAAVSGAWAQDKNNDCADNSPVADKAVQASRVAAAGPRKVAAKFSEVELSFNCSTGYQSGVATDGEYIYTSSWTDSSSSMFYKYDMEGNFIEEFNIAGCGYIRDMTYDGEYFYGVANGSTIYQIDFENKTVVGTINIENISMRSVTYDEKRDGFWVTGNWSGPLALYDRNGNKIQEGIYAGHVSGIAYYEDNTGEEHILQFHNQNRTVNDYNITTNTIQDNVLNLTTMPGYSSGSTGGCFIGEYQGEICMFADMQQSPNLIGIVPIANAKSSVFALTKAEDAEAHGTITFKVGENTVTTAQEGQTVTVEITPEEGYAVKEITGQWYAAIAAAPRRASSIDLLSDIELTAVEGEENQWTFTMERANAEISCTYTKVMKDDWIQAIADQTYTGEALEPTIVVMDGETVLEEGTDYTVTYSNNTGAGTGTVTVTGIGNYSGTATATFTIQSRAMKDLTVYVNPVEYYYTGSPVEATVIVRHGGTTLQEGVDYTLTYENNVEVGTATVTVTGMGNYTGQVRKLYLIILQINEIFFPDVNFRNYLLAMDCGADGLLTEEELSEITHLYIQGMSIEDLTGIQYLKALVYLNCHTNLLKTFDVSKNLKLNTIFCQLNYMEGAGMSDFIASLPTTEGGMLYAYDKTGKTQAAPRRSPRAEGNALTDADLADAKAKGWKVMSYDGTNWTEMSTATSLQAVKTATDAAATECYDLSGRRLQDAASRKGIVIVNGKKVVMK